MGGAPAENTHALRMSEKANRKQTAAASAIRNHSAQGFRSSLPDGKNKDKEERKKESESVTDERNGCARASGSGGPRGGRQVVPGEARHPPGPPRSHLQDGGG